MPIIKSAKKALRGSKRKKVYNDRRNKAMKGAIKSVKKLLVESKAKEALADLKTAYQAIDKAAKRGVIKKNTASRKKSRLAKLIKKSA
ncbi:MAG TPA: 30S ribosomal protein S20 [Candidatus Paceibacterota bacterium]|nr:30S ribosomal protein S20 [Candidatus Paceibacterota bacterium]